MDLQNNHLSIAGIRSLLPFLQNANNFKALDLSENNTQSKGFNTLLREIHDSPIKRLDCNSCGIDSIEISNEHIHHRHLLSLSLSENSINNHGCRELAKLPYLRTLRLNGNNINTNGCRELAKLLQRRDSSLRSLDLQNNKIDDEGVAILVGALQSDESLENLYLEGNEGISNQGLVMLLKLVNNISSIKATLQSNHTLRSLKVRRNNYPMSLLTTCYCYISINKGIVVYIS